VTDQWVPPAPTTPPPTTPSPLPPANSWNDIAACSVGPNQPSIIDGIVITGVPATISSLYWQVSLNDGSGNFQINQLDGRGNFVGTSMQGSGVDGSMTVAQDPTQPLGVVTKEYADALPPGEAPLDGQSYVRTSAAWTVQPQIIPEAPGTSQIFGRMNSVWAVVPIQVDAPSDGNTYGRFNGAWNQALAISGGTITGNLTVNQVLTVQGSNSLVLNAPIGNLRSILGMTSNIARWALTIADSTTEGLNNAGSNFSLSAYSTTGAFLGYWLTIARADGSTTFNGSGVTINGGLAVNGLLALASPNNLAIYGGSAGQFLSTNGAGILSWQTPPGAGGGIGEAPTDGGIYGRQDATWVLVPTETGIGDAPSDGNAYMRVDGAWASSGTLVGNFAVLGGSITIESPTHAILSLNKAASGDVSRIYAMTAGVLRWYMDLGDATPESGSNAGSNFTLTSCDDSGAGLVNALQIERSSGKVTLSEALSIIPPSAGLNLYLDSGTSAGYQANAILGGISGSPIWEIDLGDGGAQQNFGIWPYDDSGAIQPVAFSIARATGNATFGGSVTVAQGGGSSTFTVEASAGSAQIVLNAAGAPQQNQIWGQMNGVSRWLIQMGNGAAESAPATGSDFALLRCDNTGAVIDGPIRVARADGSVTMGSNLTVNGQFTTNSRFNAGGSNPTISWTADGAGGNPVNQNNWDIFEDNSGNLYWRSLNDAYTDSGYVLEMVRGTGYLSPSLNVMAPGGTSFAVGINFGATFASSTTDCSHHIALFGGGSSAWGGFNVTSGQLNIIASTAVAMSFGTNVAIMGPGVALQLAQDPTVPLGAATKQYVDARAPPAASTSTPLPDSGSGAVGTSAAYARADHVHPAAAAGLTWTQISQQTVVSGSTVTFSSLPQTYGDLMIVVSSINAPVSNVQLQVSANNGTSWSPASFLLATLATAAPLSAILMFHGYSSNFGQLTGSTMWGTAGAGALPASPAAVAASGTATPNFVSGFTVHTGGCNALRLSTSSGTFSAGGTVTIYAR
jgi:hypothetical protein